MNQVVHRLADERVAVERRPEQIVAIDDGAAGRGEVVGGVQIVEARQRAAERKDRGRAGRSETSTRPLGAGTCGLRRR